MVWFQCEDCGENLKKPKLANHFRICSARKLSCIDCGDTFSKESVQTHTQCMTEAEKYGPKSQGKPSQNSSSKSEKPKKNTDVDINVGLSSRPPWFCSLCNTPATSKQTLLIHADGKKHRAKVKAFCGAQKQSNQDEEMKDNEKMSCVSGYELKPVEPKENASSEVGYQQILEKFDKKRKHHDDFESNHVNSNESKNVCDINNGEVIQAEAKEEKSLSKRHKNEDSMLKCSSSHISDGMTVKKKIKWKKLVISTLKSKPDGAMKMKKLKRLVINELKVSGIDGDEVQLCNAMMEKISSSSRFVIGNKLISLALKSDKS